MNRKIKCLFFLILGILVAACQLEEDVVKNHIHNENFKIDQIKYSELIKTSLFSEAVKRIPKKKTTKTDELGRTVIEDTYGFTIIDAPVKVIESEGKITYTLQIVSDDNTGGQLENLVLYDQIIDNCIGYIIKYNTLKNSSRTESEIADDGINETIYLTMDGSTETSRQTIRITFNTCPCAPNTGCYCGGNPESPLYQNGCSSTIVYTTGQLGTGVTGDWGDGSSGNNGGTNGSNGTDPNGSSTYDPTDPNIHGNGSTTSPVSCPTCPELEEEEEESPCEQLKKLSNGNHQNINPRITELKNKVKDNVKKEWGSEFMQYDEWDSTGDLITHYLTNLKEGDGYEVALSSGKDNSSGTMILYAGGIHTHPLDGYSMFSWGDVQALLQMHNDAVSGVKTDVTLMLVCNNPADSDNPLVYALKVDDINALTTKIDNDWNNTDYDGLSEKEKKKKIFDKLKPDYETNKSNLERHFLQFYADYGISLYKAENDMSNWNKLTLGNGSGNTQLVIPTPCSN